MSLFLRVRATTRGSRFSKRVRPGVRSSTRPGRPAPMNDAPAKSADRCRHGRFVRITAPNNLTSAPRTLRCVLDRVHRNSTFTYGQWLKSSGAPNAKRFSNQRSRWGHAASIRLLQSGVPFPYGVQAVLWRSLESGPRLVVRRVVPLLISIQK